MVARVQVRAITNDEGNKLLRVVRRSSGSVVSWRQAQMVLLSAQGMDVSGIAKVTFTSADRVRDVLHLQRRRLRLAATEVRWRSAASVHAAAAAADHQADAGRAD
jgi:hypothetical protein